MEAKSIIVFTVIFTLTQGFPQNTPVPESIPITTTVDSKNTVVSIPTITTTTPVTKKSNESPTTTVKTEIRIQTLPNDDPKVTPETEVKKPETEVKKPQNPRKSGKKELDNPSKSIIDIHKTNKSHEVSGRKGSDPSQNVATEMSTVNHEDDLNNLKSAVETTLPPVKTTTVVAAVTTKIPRKIVTSSAKSTSSAIPVTKTEKPLLKTTKEPVVNDTTPKTSLLVGIVFGCLLLSVLMFVGFKRLDAIRRRREYRRMNDFLIDGMYNEM